MSAAEPDRVDWEGELTSLPRRRLAALRRAGRDLVAELEGFVREGRHPVADLSSLAGGRFVEAERYPTDSVGDPQSGCSWFYHAHAGWGPRPWVEHGHFHCFVDSDRLPRKVRPLIGPEVADPPPLGCVHLIGVGVDPRGVPTTLFAPNRWVTDEQLYPADSLAPMAWRYGVETGGQFASTSRWLGAVVRLLQPQIARVLQGRDARLQAHRAAVGEGYGEDRDLEIAAFAAIDIDAWLAVIDRAWDAGRSGPNSS